MLGAVTSIAATTLVVSCASAPQPKLVEVIDWTDKACESPAYQSIVGNYSGPINYGDSEARACRWDAEISVIGVSMAAECTLSGTISATPTTAQGDGYQCSTMDAATRFVVALSDPDMNRSGPSSVIIHLQSDLPQSDSAGNPIIQPVLQYESLTAENNALVTSTGNILSRQ
jgi:hypothetical protein